MGGLNPVRQILNAKKENPSSGEIRYAGSGDMKNRRSAGPRLLITDRRSAIWLERARVHVQDGRVVYDSSDDNLNRSFSIPYINIAVLFLGTGTSITSEATRLLSEEGCHIATTGSGGTPMHMGSLTEHGDSRYFRGLLPAFMYPNRALEATRAVMQDRISRVETIGVKLARKKMPAIRSKAPFSGPCSKFMNNIEDAKSVPELLGYEGEYARNLYGAYAKFSGIKEFKRIPQGGSEGKIEIANSLIDHGNYLCYGMAGAALWALGVPPNMSIFHGKTRSGGLVYDLADSVKDAFVLPIAFGTAMRAKDAEEAEKKFRSDLLDAFDDHRILILLIETLRSMIKACEK